MLEWVKTSNLKIMLDGLFGDPSTKFFTAEGYIFTVVASRSFISFAKDLFQRKPHIEMMLTITDFALGEADC
ncbi:4683_t:CDS:2 [Funneliformis mosseae]|uniref:4683_t:CDS:1 n=1 Tax=Funneliformis mosseae TaxID=27381 RepID=A0A9N9BS31_FUNMO|nr:4683_t:CDS:2 [Funneliformis mosseae]